MKKKMLVLLASCVLAVSMTACGGSDSKKETAAASAKEGQTVEEKDVKEEKEVKKEKDAEESKPDAGVWNGNDYTNEFAGITFHMPEDWVAATDEELLSTMDLGSEYTSLDEKAYEKALKGTYCPMGASAVSGTNLFLMFENLKETAMFSANMTESQYLQALKSQLSAGVSGLQYTIVTEDGETELSGQKYHYLEATTSTQGMTITQYYVVRKIDHYMCAFIITSMDQTLEDITALFS